MIQDATHSSLHYFGADFELILILPNLCGFLHPPNLIFTSSSLISFAVFSDAMLVLRSGSQLQKSWLVSSEAQHPIQCCEPKISTSGIWPATKTTDFSRSLDGMELDFHHCQTVFCNWGGDYIWNHLNAISAAIRSFAGQTSSILRGKNSDLLQLHSRGKRSQRMCHPDPWTTLRLRRKSRLKVD